MGTRNVSFSIQGEFITELGRKKFFEEHNLQAAIRILTGSLQSDQLTESEIEKLAYDILNGRAEIVGTYPNDDYKLIYIEGKENAQDMHDAICKWQIENDINKTAANKLAFLKSFLKEHCPWKIKEINDSYEETYDEPLFEIENISYQDRMLESFMERMSCESTDDYGWLEPDGTFHPVEWGEHEKWATNHVQTKMSHNDWFKANTPTIPGKVTTSYGDYLIEQKWILLHNPAQGIAFPTKHPSVRMTKQQKEFLYDYYIKRNQHKKANELYQDNKE